MELALLNRKPSEGSINSPNAIEINTLQEISI